MIRYRMLNLNPLNEIENDCVCRAISLGLAEDYYKIQEKIKLIGQLFECDSLCVCCYQHLLDNVYGLERVKGFKGMTVNQFASYNYRGAYLVRVDGHLTCVIDGKIYDTWDCGNEIVDIIWAC